MKQSPTVSVVMPVYNVERYVAQAVESILAQTFADFELLILDDGSRDRSLSILQTLAAQDKRIRLISRENQGIPRTRNELLSQSRGEFIAPMDSDDIALPDRLTRQVEFLQHHPDYVCVGGAYQLIDAADRLILNHFAMPQEDEDIQSLMLKGHVSLHQPCVMFRRQATIDVGGYDETLPVCEDLDLWLRLGEVGKLANLPQPVLQYRLHQNSISEQQQAIALDKMQEICKRAWQRRGIEGNFEVTEHWRSGKDAASRHRFLVQYGWWAFSSGQRQTAGIYALQAIRTLPLHPEGWRLLACAVLKPLPEATVQNLNDNLV
jgi:glycosyltransferase involved in cell wall biosynthesis